MIQQSKIQNQLVERILIFPPPCAVTSWEIQTIPVADVKLFLVKLYCKVLTWMLEGTSWIWGLLLCEGDFVQFLKSGQLFLQFSIHAEHGWDWKVSHCLSWHQWTWMDVLGRWRCPALMDQNIWRASRKLAQTTKLTKLLLNLEVNFHWSRADLGCRGVRGTTSGKELLTLTKIKELWEHSLIFVSRAHSRGEGFIA